MNKFDLMALAQCLNNWKDMNELSTEYPQFSRSTLKHMFWTQAERPGLARCTRIVGKKRFVNVPMFGLWLAGALPEQQQGE